MTIFAKIEGLSKIVRNIRKAKQAQADAYVRGLKKAGLFLQRQSQKVVPVDTGALKSSAYTRITGKGFKADAIVGYTQSYAIYVHENLTARHKPGKIAKFLEVPARRFRKVLLQMLQDEMKKARLR